MTALTFTVNKEGGSNIVHLKGSLANATESNLRDLLNSPEKEFTFDFKEVEVLNTVGIREWIVFINEFSNRKKVKFQNCSSNIVMLINMLPEFLGNAELESVFRTYYCDHCAKSFEMIYAANKNMPSKDQIAAEPNLDNFIPCACGKESIKMESEVPADEFYGFLKN